jgi:MFS family permease
MQKESSGRAAKSDIDPRLLVPFLLHVTLAQTLILVIRVTTSYRTIELELPVVWVGIIATGFAIVPAFTALAVGRWIDRGNDARACWLGAALILLAAIGFCAWSRSALHLLACSVLLGFGHMFCMAGHQMIAVRVGGIRSRESVLGWYMVAASLGQGLGPFIVGWLGGSAAIPPTTELFALSLGAAVFGLGLALSIAPQPRPARHGEGAEPVPIRQLLKLRGFPAVMVSSVVTITD